MNINLVIPLSEKLNDKLSGYYYQKFSDSTNKNYLEKAIVSGLVITKEPISLIYQSKKLSG
jgi:hypothetical protein